MVFRKHISFLIRKNHSHWLLMRRTRPQVLTYILKYAAALRSVAPITSLMIMIFVFPNIVFAQTFETKAGYAILIDDKTGAVLFEKDADVSMAPSSMSKLMTIYILFDRLKSGEVKLTDKFNVSEKAWRTGGSKMFVKVDSEILVEDLIRGIIIQSGNDACVVVAEGLAGAEEVFAQKMNMMAEKLGLKNSHFKNSTGLPEDGHEMSVRDLAILAKHLIDDFPEYYHYFAEKEFVYNKINQPNRNLLLYRNINADGLKTGHAEKAGYGIVASAARDGRRLIAVVNGLKGEKERADEAQKLLEYGFGAFEVVTLFKAGEAVEEAEVWFGKKNAVPLVTKEDITFTLPRYSKGDLGVSVLYNSPIAAPIGTETSIAELLIKRKDAEDVKIPLFAGEKIEKISFFKHLIRSLKYHIKN